MAKNVIEENTNHRKDTQVLGKLVPKKCTFGPICREPTLMRDVFGVAGYSDRCILRTSVAVSILITLANVGVELGWKLSYGQNLIATSHTYMYMGMEVLFALKPSETVLFC